MSCVRINCYFKLLFSIESSIRKPPRDTRAFYDNDAETRTCLLCVLGDGLSEFFRSDVDFSGPATELNTIW